MEVSAIAGIGYESDRLDKELFGARLVTSTLGTVDSGGAGTLGVAGGAQEAYGFSKNVIFAAMQGKGLLADLNV